MSSKIHGLPCAARPIIMASAPVHAKTRAAFSGRSISPLAITGILTCRLTSRIVSYSALPANLSARVRPWIAMAAIPAFSATRAMAATLRHVGSQPVRVLSVTGMSTAETTASRMRATRRSSRSSAEPAATLQTFFAGHPMLMSMMSAPSAALRLAASAMLAGSAPTIWTETGPASPLWSSRRTDLRDPHSEVSAVIISDTARAAPKRRHSWRNGRSVVPAMGASISLFGKE